MAGYNVELLLDLLRVCACGFIHAKKGNTTAETPHINTLSFCNFFHLSHTFPKKQSEYCSKHICYYIFIVINKSNF